MWVAIGVLFLLYIAWCSGEHHGDRAKRIVEKNRPERQRKWRELNRIVRKLETENNNLRNIIKRMAK